MSLYLIDRCSVAVCILLSMAANATPAIPAGDDINGPTVILSYGGRTAGTNSFASFMYFTPLVSPTLVDVETSAGNQQQVSIVSYTRKITSKSFYVKCEFEMLGNGFHKYTFDAAEVIASHAGESKKGETLTKMIDYIEFDGEGLGSIEVKGTIAGSTQTVTEVGLKFNARGRKSPVTLGLYNVKPEEGLYKYENKSGELIARVDTFIFKKSDDDPRMGVNLASVDKASNPGGFLGGVKAALANWFVVKPRRVSNIGNDTMLKFGAALLREEPAFTFPRAKNIRETRTAAVNNE